MYARPGDDGFELLDERGEVAQTRTGSVGLVAATRFQDQQPTWIITGTDDAGVAAAAAALRTDVLTNRFAVALIEGKAENLPLRRGPMMIYAAGRARCTPPARWSARCGAWRVVTVALSVHHPLVLAVLIGAVVAAACGGPGRPAGADRGGVRRPLRGDRRAR